MFLLGNSLSCNILQSYLIPHKLQSIFITFFYLVTEFMTPHLNTGVGVDLPFGCFWMRPTVPSVENENICIFTSCQAKVLHASIHFVLALSLLELKTEIQKTPQSNHSPGNKKDNLRYFREKNSH